MLISLQKPYDGFPSFGLKTKIPLIPLLDWRKDYLCPGGTLSPNPPRHAG